MVKKDLEEKIMEFKNKVGDEKYILSANERTIGEFK